MNPMAAAEIHWKQPAVGPHSLTDVISSGRKPKKSKALELSLLSVGFLEE